MKKDVFAFLARQQKTLLITSVIPRYNAFAAWRIHLFLMEAFCVCGFILNVLTTTIKLKC